MVRSQVREVLREVCAQVNEPWFEDDPFLPACRMRQDKTGEVLDVRTSRIAVPGPAIEQEVRA